MTDLNKLREEFEQLQNIKYHIDMHHVFYCGKDGYKTNIAELNYVVCYVKGAWYAYQKQQAKFDLYMNDFTVAANCVKSQQKIIKQLQAQLDRTEEDSERIDFLADKNQWIANVQLPREIVERNLSSLRDAIDRAMDMVNEQNDD